MNSRYSTGIVPPSSFVVDGRQLNSGFPELNEYRTTKVSLHRTKNYRYCNGSVKQAQDNGETGMGPRRDY